MYHVHSSSLSSSTSTTESVSSLPPHVLFPFFQPPPPSSSTATPTCSTTTTSSSSSSTSPPSAFSPGCPSCPLSVGGGGQPFPALPFPVSPNFISLPSSNSYQSILLPLPSPVAPFPPSSATGPVPTASPFHSSPPTAAPTTAGGSPSPAGHSPVAPLLVFSHGSTSVDTFVPASRVLQRTLYTWSQLSDYTVMHCWNLPASATSSTSFPSPSSLSFSNGSGRLCGEAEVAKCPGHPWVNYSYHMQVKQWQEHRPEGCDLSSAAQPTAANPPQAEATAGDGLQRREGGWLGAMGGKVPEVRVLSPSEVFNGRRRSMEEEDGGLEASEAEEDEDDWDEHDWDDVCTTEGEEEDDGELTDVDM